jgi:hypothetical protein
MSILETNLPQGCGASPARAASLHFPLERSSRAVWRENWQDKTSDQEWISDEEIRLAIRYLDPEVSRKAQDVTPFIALFVVILTLCAIWFSFHLRGL